MKYLFFLFLSCCLPIFLSAQQASFLNLFEEIEFEQLHVYSFARIEFNSTHTFPYKGQKIPKESLSFLIPIIDSSSVSYRDFFAISHFPVSKTLEGYLVRESIGQGTENVIYYLLYDLSKKQFINKVTLANAYSYESASGSFETWLLDLNKDGYLDFLKHSQEELLSMENGEVDLVYSFQTFITFFEKGKMKEIEIIDTVFKEQLLKDFPCHKRSYLSYPLQSQLKVFLKNQGQKKKSDESTDWAIIVGSDKNLESAIIEKKRFTKIFKQEDRYNINPWTNIYQKNERYYTIFDGYFDTKVQAEIALRELQNKFNQTAYIVDLKKWCPTNKYHRDKRVCE